MPTACIAVPGDWIAYDRKPAIRMMVQAVKTCDLTPAGTEPHHAYQVTDPSGETDWVCALDVHHSPHDLSGPAGSERSGHPGGEPGKQV